MAATLDQASRNPLYAQPNELFFPVGGKLRLEKTGLTGWANDYYDIRAPGIREQMPNPSMPYFGPTPSSAWLNTTYKTGNVPHPPNFDNMPGWMTSAWGQRMGAFWFEELQNTANDQHWMFRDLGQFSVPSPGVSALADLIPTSTRPFL